MVYVFDTNSLRVFGNYYPEIFGGFWAQLNELVDEGRVGSVREVKKELDFQASHAHLLTWAQQNEAMFSAPTDDEMTAVSAILAVPHFEQLIPERARLRGSPVADPFIVARAQVCGARVVTEEVLKPNSAKIPNVCGHFGVPCMNVQEFLRQENWTF
jgi:hypothetical protein